ncbi:phosphoribosyltransferase [Candidatus Parcubacteria bacterium]|nr:MAG: phosphoribosyltransferase [Candidatus Parcubacteria bacterium]
MARKRSWIVALLVELGAWLKNIHVVFTNGGHGEEYVNKDAVYPYVLAVKRICAEMARAFKDDAVEVVAAPAVGGVALEQWVAYALSKMTGRQVLGVYVEKPRHSLCKAKKGEQIPYTLVLEIPSSNGNQTVKPVTVRGVLLPEQELIIEDGSRVVFGRGYADLVKGRRVLVAEDVLNTGGTVEKTVNAVEDAGGRVVGVTAVFNRGGVTAEKLGVPVLDAMVDVQMENWPQGECPLCAQDVPIHTGIGHGKQFLAQKEAAAKAAARSAS